jgi:formylglycine-generating enzyme required for sulfatase activity
MGANGVSAHLLASVAAANAALAESDAGLVYRLVHHAEIAYTESDDMEVDLDRLQSTHDGHLDSVHALRDTWGADLVCLFRRGTTSNTAGIAFLLTETGGDASRAFSVVADISAISMHAFAHELGHNLGANHARGDTYAGQPAWGGIFAHANGYRFNSSGGQMRTIMAYQPGTMLSLFSNPDALYRQVPCGKPEGDPESADVAKTFRQIAPLVAGYRPHHPYIEIEPGQTTLTELAHAYMVSIRSNTGWDVHNPLDWVAVSAASGTGYGRLILTVAANPVAAERSGVIRINDSTHTVIQAGSDPGRVTVTPVSMSQRSGSKVVNVLYDLEHDGNLDCRVNGFFSVNYGNLWMPMGTATGDIGRGIRPGAYRSIAWRAGYDLPAAVYANVRVRLVAHDGRGAVPVENEFVTIQPGVFRMGSPPDEPGRLEYEGPRHRVVMTQAYHLARTEVTWGLWRGVRAHAAEFGYTDLYQGRMGNYGDHRNTALDPVTMVTWWDVIKWCNLRSELDGLQPVYHISTAFTDKSVLRKGTANLVRAHPAATGYRLPTEAEWEYAARAGSDTAFCNGPIIHTGLSPIDPNLDAVGWFYGNSSEHNTRPVAGKQANAWGLYDMHGNVNELCWDWFADYSLAEQVDPAGPVTGTSRVTRGGSINSQARGTRSAVRSGFGISTTDRSSNTGFRLARNVAQP